MPASRKVRGEDQIPAVIYGQGESRLCSVGRKDFEELRKGAVGSASLVELSDEGGSSTLTLIKDVHGMLLVASSFILIFRGCSG